jgi:phosphate/sulfate permease
LSLSLSLSDPNSLSFVHYTHTYTKGGIVLSWVASPALSGALCSTFYLSTDYFIFKAEDPSRNALKGLPVIFGATIFFMTYLVIVKAPQSNLSDEWSWGVAALLGFVAVVCGWALGNFFLEPRFPSRNRDVVPSVSMNQKLMTNHVIKEIDGDEKHQDSCQTGTEKIAARMAAKMTDKQGNPLDEEAVKKAMDKREDAVFCFKYLLVFTAALQSFAHGSNDTANATAPFSAILDGYENGLNACGSPETAPWVLVVAGFFVFLGVGIGKCLPGNPLCFFSTCMHLCV